MNIRYSSLLFFYFLMVPCLLSQVEITPFIDHGLCDGAIRIEPGKDIFFMMWS